MPTSVPRLSFAFIKNRLTQLWNSYEGEDTIPSKPSVPPPAARIISSDAPVVVNGTTSTYVPQPPVLPVEIENFPHFKSEPELDTHIYEDNVYGDDGSGAYNGHSHLSVPVTTEQGFTGTVGIKEDG